jgi:clan AA aspartic protease
MTDTVDDSGRALLHISLRHPATGVENDVDAWVDTGFTGDLVLPRPQVVSLGLPLGPTVRAVLADGSEINLETFTCLLQWFGEWKAIEIVANDGQFPLIGVGLLLEHTLHIEYLTRSLTLD